LLFAFLMITVPTGVRWSLSVVLICISFMAEDIEHFFMHLLAIILLLRNVCPSHLPSINWIICSFSV
jgi:hypothetical protein